MHNPGRGYRNQFRIIGGQWRRRRLTFPALPGIRPSPDRVRETLFNWLMHYMPGKRCLDLFAGSGALGLEALSRGAASVVFVDRERRVIETLRGHLATLGAMHAEAVQADALDFLRGAAQPFDLVFLDPPFDSTLLAQCLPALTHGAWLTPQALIYMEYSRAVAPALPPGWQLTRTRQAGQVRFSLAGPAAAQLAAD